MYISSIIEFADNHKNNKINELDKCNFTNWAKKISFGLNFAIPPGHSDLSGSSKNYLSPEEMI